MDTNFLVLLKPDAVKRGLVGKIIARFEKKGFVLKQMKSIIPTYNLVTQHYFGHIERNFFEELVAFMTSGTCVAIVFYGNLCTAMSMIGDKPWLVSSQGTVRGDYASSVPQNLIHCSHSYEAANKEVELWFGLVPNDQSST